MNAGDRKERRIAWAMLILCPLSLLLVCALVTMGYGRGLIYHRAEYLQITCIAWAAIMTVLPILRLTRLITLPYWFTALLYSNMYMFALSLCYGLYLDPDTYWWANFTHVISSMVVAAIVFMALCLMESRSPPHVTLGGRGGITAMVFVISCAFGAIWEVIEGFTDIISKFDYMSYGAVHTLWNLVADTIGAAIMAAIVFVILSGRSAEQVVSEIRLGRKNIDAPE